MEKRIEDYKLEQEKMKQKMLIEASSIRWIVDYDSALNSGEVKK
jgi:hypothetical protein